MRLLIIAMKGSRGEMQDENYIPTFIIVSWRKIQ